MTTNLLFNIDKKRCVMMRRGKSTWKNSDCSNRFAFICMKGGNLKSYLKLETFHD